MPSSILEEIIIGVIEIRNGNHIGLLFVDDRYHKNGIAKNLISLAIEKVKATLAKTLRSPRLRPMLVPYLGEPAGGAEPTERRQQ